MTSLKPSSITSVVRIAHALMLNGKPLPLFLWGAPGIGKSAIVKAYAKENDLDLIDVRALLLDPVDLRGIPVPKGDVMTFLRPDFLPTEGSGILFLDELPLAPQMVQNACLELVLDRRIGNYKLPDGWMIIAAGNRESDRAGVQRLSTPLSSRFDHIEVAIDNEDWMSWAVKADVAPEVMAFLRFRPELLHKFDPKSNDKEFPCPRTWEFVSNIVKQEPPAAIEHPIYGGCVGDGAAGEFVSFVRVYRDLPELKTIETSPDTATIPREDQTSVLYATVTMIGRFMTRANSGALFKYLDRLPPEFRAIAVFDAIKRDKDIKMTKGFQAWIVNNKSFIA